MNLNLIETSMDNEHKFIKKTETTDPIKSIRRIKLYDQMS